MADQSKRTTLKKLATVASIVAMPGTVHAAMGADTADTNVDVVRAHLQSQLHAQQISIDIVPVPEYSTVWVRFKNLGDAEVTLDQISPCLIRSGDKRYDVNAELKRDARKIAPNATCAFFIEAI